jgi:DNA-binding transcriptional LysR family regulator
LPFDNRFSLYKLEVFCSVVDAGGVGRAAESLFLTQPVVSNHLRSLQEHMGVTLLERHGRGLRLTDAGRAVYEWACEVLSRTRRIARELDDLGAGRRESLVVVAGASLASYVLPPIVCRLRLDHADARIALQVAEPTHALGAVRSGDGEVAVVVARSPEDLGDLAYEQLRSEDVVLVTRPGGDAGEQTVTLSGDQLTIHDLAELLAEARCPMPVTATELGHPEAVKVAVREGLGSAFLLRSAVERELTTGELQEVTLPGRLTVPVYAAWQPGREPGRVHAALIDALRPDDGRVIALALPSESVGDRRLCAA